MVEGTWTSPGGVDEEGWVTILSIQQWVISRKPLAEESSETICLHPRQGGGCV